MFLCFCPLYLLIFHYYPMFGVQIAFKDFIAVQGNLEQPMGRLKTFPDFLFFLPVQQGCQQYPDFVFLSYPGWFSPADFFCVDPQYSQEPAF